MIQAVPIRIGLIGLGKMGQNHLRVLSMLKSVDFRFVFDIDVTAARNAAAPYQILVADDLDAALGEVEAVVICSPTVTHADYMRQAALHVKNIFVEKPLAETSFAAKELVDLASARNLNVQVGFIERFNPAVRSMKTILDKSQHVISVDFTRTNRLSSRITDVDVVTDLMIHDIDLALFLNGPVSDVAAYGFREGSMIDLASALLTHFNGRFSRIQASRVTEKRIRSIEATCLDMFVDCDLLRKEIVINRESKIRQASSEPYVISAVSETVSVTPQEALLLELQTFVASCSGIKVQDTPDGTAALAAQLICDRIRGAVAP